MRKIIIALIFLTTSILSKAQDTIATTRFTRNLIVGTVSSSADPNNIYPEQYGLIGDDATVNSQANVQAFFNACSGGKTGVILPNKMYRYQLTTNNLEIKSNTNIRGGFINSGFRMTSTTISPAFGIRIYPQRANIKITGIEFNTANSTNTGTSISSLFVEDNVINLTLEGCTFKGGKGEANLTIKGSATQPDSLINITYCKFDSAQGKMTDFRAVYNGHFDYNNVTRWGISIPASPGVQLGSGLTNKRFSISNNNFQNVYGTQFAIEAVGNSDNQYIHITNNTFADTLNLGGNGISGYFSYSLFSDNMHSGGLNNQRSGYEIFGSYNKINNNIIKAGSLIMGAGSNLGQDALYNEIYNNVVLCANTNASAIIISGYSGQKVQYIKVHDNAASTVGGSGNSSAIKIGTYSNTALAQDIEIYNNTIFSSANGIRLEAASGSTRIYIEHNKYKQGSPFILVTNNNLSGVYATDNVNTSGSDSAAYSVTVTNPIIWAKAGAITSSGGSSGLDPTHPITTGGTPAISNTQGTSIVPSILISGTDANMKLTFTVASNQTANGYLGTVTFASAWTLAPKASINPSFDVSNKLAIDTKIAVGEETTTTFKIFTGSLSAGTYIYTIKVMQ